MSRRIFTTELGHLTVKVVSCYSERKTTNRIHRIAICQTDTGETNKTQIGPYRAAYWIKASISKEQETGSDYRLYQES